MLFRYEIPERHNEDVINVPVYLREKKLVLFHTRATYFALNIFFLQLKGSFSIKILYHSDNLTKFELIHRPVSFIPSGIWKDAYK